MSTRANAARQTTSLGILALAVVLMLLPGCAPGEGGAARRSAIRVESIHTDLSAGSCLREVDRNDPNETAYLACPGVAGYSLHVRRVGSGRISIDVVDPAGRAMPLSYQEVVTPQMSSVGDRAEWRVATEGGRQVPIALIVRVLAREDADNPERVSATYIAVAKVTPDTACVTDRLLEGGQSDVQVRGTADSARERACASPLPRL